MSESIVIANSTIRQQDGLYCLNDLHRASGGKAKSQPSYFLRTQQTQDLVNKINHSANMQSAVRVINGGENRGTYVCKQLVIDDQDFLTILSKTPNGGRPSREYYISLGMMKLAQKLEIAV